MGFRFRDVVGQIITSASNQKLIALYVQIRNLGHCLVICASLLHDSTPQIQVYSSKENYCRRMSPDVSLKVQATFSL